jgi:hypothetical protein
MSNRPLGVLLLLAFVACSPGPDESAQARDPGWVECVVPRPEVCTKEWRPVCGLRDTGVRCVTTPCPSWETKTYGNACAACADPDVYGWRPGECEREGVVEDG